VKDAAGSAGLRQQALKVLAAAAQKDGADEARKLAAELATGKVAEAKKGAAPDWPALIGNLDDLMTPLATKAKGGEGIHPDLQYTAKLKGQNGVEALIIALSNKKPSDASVGKMSKELELLGYRVATMGALALRRGPGKKHANEVKEWDEQSIVMRESAIDLAVAARKKDGAAVFESTRRLINSCVECHANFK
jgi:hypothetical protein